MLALTLRQPAASSVFFGKDVENRCWSTHYRGLLAIHAGSARSVTRQKLDALLELQPSAAKRKSIEQFFTQRSEPYSAIIGVVMLRDIVRNASSVYAERNCYHWLISNAVLLDKPIASKGYQKLWRVSLNAQREIKRQLMRQATRCA